MRRLIPSIVLALSFLAAPAFAALPQILSYQGVLTDNGGALVPDGLYSITFRIYDDPTLGGAHLLWTEAHDGVTASKIVVLRGGFDVQLGTSVPLNAFNVPLWLELQVAPDATPLSPRTTLAAAPYALNVRNVYAGDFNNFVGIGRSAAITTGEFFGVQAPVLTGTGGMYVQTGAAATRPFYGYSTNGAYKAWTYLDGQDANKWKVSMNNTDMLTLTTDGRLGVGTTAPTTQLEVNGGSKLGGASAPAIKMLKFTGNLAATQGQSVVIVTGVPVAKMLAVQVMVDYTGNNNWMPASYTDAQYWVKWYSSNPDAIILECVAGHSAGIVGLPYRVVLTYEE